MAEGRDDDRHRASGSRSRGGRGARIEDPAGGGVDGCPGRGRLGVGAALAQRRGLADALAQEVQLRPARTPWRTTSIFSIRGPSILKVRSTPTPLAIRRTVIERVMPPPRSRMTVPSKTWIRSRFPPRPWPTPTVSPGRVRADRCEAVPGPFRRARSRGSSVHLGSRGCKGGSSGATRTARASAAEYSTAPGLGRRPQRAGRCVHPVRPETGARRSRATRESPTFARVTARGGRTGRAPIRPFHRAPGLEDPR